MDLLNMCAGIAQNKRWAELGMEPPKPPKVKPEPIPFIELTISPEIQAYIDYMIWYREWVKEYMLTILSNT